MDLLHAESAMKTKGRERSQAYSVSAGGGSADTAAGSAGSERPRRGSSAGSSRALCSSPSSRCVTPSTFSRDLLEADTENTLIVKYLDTIFAAKETSFPT